MQSSKKINNMELKLKRKAKRDTYVIGDLSVNEVYFSNTLEDTDRGLTSDMTDEQIEQIKQKGITAIPTGRYKVVMNIQSPKFSKYKQYEFCDGYLPRLVDVPGFEGILIHIGNYPKDTDGCILVGKNTVKGAVMESTATFKELYDILKNADEAGEDIYITIE